MEITGKIIAALEPQGGVSARTGNSWKVQSFVIETIEQYPKKCVFEVFGEDRLQQFNIQVGQHLTVSFDIDAREYNGRWYNSLRAWRVVPAEAAGPAPMVAGPASVGGATAPATAANIPAPSESELPAEDDLPF